MILFSFYSFQEVLGWHTNFPMARSGYTTAMTVLGALWPSLVVEPELQDRMYPLGKVFSFLVEESGYMHIQATKPDTVGKVIRIGTPV